MLRRPGIFRRACADLARFGPSRQIEAKGKAEPLSVCSLEGLI
jgi:hypothetical protein